jgi:tetratricopeptide (TPR) repeat protein
MGRTSSGSIVSAILAILLLATTIVAPATAATKPVPPAAREAFERGLAAAEQQQWPLAIRYFREARNAAGSHFGDDERAALAWPALLYNLGLAHGKAGQELPAIAWLHAYLAAAPQAPNAEAVRKEIIRLDVATEAKIARIMREADASTSAADKGEADFRAGTARLFQAAGGDVEGAIKRGVRSDMAWSKYAESLARAGWVERAEEAVQRISDPEARDRLYSSYMVTGVLGRSTPQTPTSRREFDLARAFATRIGDPGRRATSVVLLLSKDFRAGDFPLAETTLIELRSPGVSAPETKSGELLLAMIKTAVTAKDFEAARGSADRLLKLRAWGMPAQTPNPVFDAVTMIPAAQLAQGDVNGAKAMAAKLAPSTTGPMRAALQAVLGTYESAREFVRTLSCGDDGRELKRRLVEWVIFVEVTTGAVPAAKTTATTTPPCGATPTTNRHDYVGALINALVRRGDLRGAAAAAKENAGVADPLALADLIRRAVGRDALVAIEQAVPLLVTDEYARSRIRLVLAEAYAARGATGDAERLRVEAARFLLVRPEYAPDVPSKMIATMARALEQSGDAAAARIMSGLARRDLVGEWLSKAQELSSREVAVDLPTALKTATQGKPSSEAAQELAFVGVKLAEEWFALRAVGLRTAEP